MNFKQSILVVMSMVCFAEADCQTENNRVIEQIIETFAETTNEDFDYSEVYERLNYYSKHPLNLNTASAEQLQELFLLSPIQIQEILKYRAENGRLIDLLELQSIEVLTTETIKSILPFSTLQEPLIPAGLNPKTLFSKGQNEFMALFGQTLQKPKGYLPAEGKAASSYAGGAQRS